MGKHLENWLTIWKEEEALGMIYDRSHEDLLSIYKKRYEIISVDPFPDRTAWLMRAHAYASKHKLSMPTWVIEGLDSNLRRCQFFTAASKEKHVDKNEAMERTGLKDYELAAKVFKDEIEWRIKLGNWLPEETQAVWRNRVKDDGMTWIDKEDMIHFLVLDNLDDFLFPESAIRESVPKKPKQERYVEVRKKCRKKANLLWKKYDEMSLGGMARHREIMRICKNDFDYTVVEKRKDADPTANRIITFGAIENWIKDLRPKYRG